MERGPIQSVFLTRTQCSWDSPWIHYDITRFMRMNELLNKFFSTSQKYSSKCTRTAIPHLSADDVMNSDEG